MRHLRALLLSVAFVAACGPSGAPPQTRVGIASAAPPSGRTINYDPSVVGLPAAIGTTVYDSAGVISWTKYATSNTAWRPVPVSQLVTGDPSQAPGLKAPLGFVVTKNDGTASWVKRTASDTGWQTFPGVNTADGGTPLSAPVVNASLATMAGQTVKGNAGNDAGVPADLTQAQLMALVADPGATLVENYVSAQIDVTTTSAANVIVPARAGLLFVPREIIGLTKSVGGAFSTAGTVVIKSGANTVISNALMTATNFSKGALTGLAINTTAGVPALAGQPWTVDVSVAATGTGGFAYTALFLVKGFWVAFP